MFESLLGNNLDMDLRLTNAQVFKEPCPLCKDMLGIEVIHPPAVWDSIIRRTS